LFGLRWVKCWVKRTLKWRPLVFAAAASLILALDYVRFGAVQLPSTLVGGAFMSVADLYFIGAFLALGSLAAVCAEALKRALLWSARNRAGLFAGLALGLAFAAACGALDVSLLACAAIYAPIAYLALGQLNTKGSGAEKAAGRPEGRREIRPKRRGRLIFDLSNPGDVERLMQLISAAVDEEERQLLKLDCQTIQRLILSDEGLLAKVRWLYEKTGDPKLLQAMDVARLKVQYWLNMG